MLRILSVLSVSLVVIITLRVPPAQSTPLIQIEPAVRDRIVPAAVEIGIALQVTEDGVPYEDVLPIGSGTVISPRG